MGCGGCSENVSWHMFALAIQGGWYRISSAFFEPRHHFKTVQRKAWAFLFYSGSIKAKSILRQGSNLKPERFMTVKVRSVTCFEPPLWPGLVEDRVRLQVIPQSCQS